MSLSGLISLNLSLGLAGYCYDIMAVATCKTFITLISRNITSPAEGLILATCVQLDKSVFITHIEKLPRGCNMQILLWFHYIYDMEKYHPKVYPSLYEVGMGVAKKKIFGVLFFGKT